MRFSNRAEAARLLAERLDTYKGDHPLVLAIPRGAVPMAKIIADTLGGDLDVILVRKLGAPGNSEYAIGSVDEGGHVMLNPDAEGLYDESYIEAEKRLQMETILKRRALYTPIHPAIDPAKRTVIVVDDGIATGYTMLAALRALRAKHTKKIVVAIGVASKESLEQLKNIADEVVCLYTPSLFFAVGEYFDEFPQVGDEEVVKILGKF